MEERSPFEVGQDGLCVFGHERYEERRPVKLNYLVTMEIDDGEEESISIHGEKMIRKSGLSTKNGLEEYEGSADNNAYGDRYGGAGKKQENYIRHILFCCIFIRYGQDGVCGLYALTNVKR